VEFNAHHFSKFRRVCKQWNEVLLPIWRKNATIKITGESHDDNAILFDEYMTLLQSEEDLHQLRRHPFKKYLISYWEMGLEEQEKLAFWQEGGPSMIHLKLKYCDFKTAGDLRKVLFELTPNLHSANLHENFFTRDRPNDKAVRLDPTRKEHLKPDNVQKNLRTMSQNWIDNDEIGEYWDMLGITWMELFAHFPNIEQMKLGNIRSTANDPLEELAECVKSMEIIRENLGPEYFTNFKQLDLRRV